MLERDVRKISGEHKSRKIGEAPNIGKVLRSPQSGVKYKRGNLTARGRRKKKHRIIMAWSIVFTVFSVIVVLGFVIYHFSTLTPPEKTSQPLPTETPNLENFFSDPETQKSQTPGQVKSLELVQIGIKNRDPELLAEYFHLPEGQDTAAALKTLHQIQAKEGKITKFEWIGTKFANGRILEQVAVFMENEERAVNRLAQLLPDRNGTWKIDFDSYVRRSTPDWETILAGNSALSTVRVFATNDTYYNGIYSDDTVWQCYTVVSPDAYDVLYAYAKKDSAQFRAMQKILELEDEVHRVTLEIRKDPDSGDRQFTVARVLAENWVVGESAFDESY